MFSYPFLHMFLMCLASLILFIVIGGPLLSQVSQATNIIWSYLMIALTTCGLFLFALNNTPLAPSLTSSPMPPRLVRRPYQGTEFYNSSACTLFLTRGIHLHMSCPLNLASKW